MDSTSGLSSQISFVTLSPRGTIAVANMVTTKVQFFSQAGKLLGTFDGASHGMQSMNAQHSWVGDTLIVNDLDGVLSYRIAPDFKVRTTPQPSWGGRPITPLSSSVAANGGLQMTASLDLMFTEATFADGSVLVRADDTHLPSQVWAGRPANTQALVRVSSTGVFQRVVAWVPYDDCAHNGAVSALCAGTKWNRYSDGRSVAIVTTGKTGPDSAGYRVTVVKPNGDTVFSRRYGYTPIALNTRDSAREAPNGITSYPPLSEVLVGRDGTIWLAAGIRGPTPITERRWTVLAPNGDPLGSVSLPVNVSLQDADRSTIWGMEFGPWYTAMTGAPSRTRGGAVIVYKVAVAGGVP